MNWDQRSYEKEWLDRDDIPFADIKKNMEELNFINQYLGGHAITLRGLKTILHKLFQNPISYNQPVSDKAEFYPSIPSRRGPLSILEIGCGGGDNLRVIKAWAEKKGIAVQLTGVDINEACVQFAKAQSRNAGINFICADYKTVSLQQHIIFSSLFCHHFTDEALVEMLHWIQRHATAGFFINDLHRHPAAYYSIKALTTLFSKSYLVRHDAPLSVLRGFKRWEWAELFQKAMLENCQIRWQWAFRWLIIYTV